MKFVSGSLLLLIWSAASAAQPEVRPEIEVRRERVEAQSAVFLDWVRCVTELPDDEQAALRKSLQVQLRRSEMQWQDDDQRSARSLPRHAPIVFTSERGAARYFQHSRIMLTSKKLLSEQSLAVLTAALNDRREAVREANLNYLVSLIDDVVFLAPEQREPFTQALAERMRNLNPRICDLDAGLFAFDAHAHYLNYQSLALVVSRIPGGGLHPHQQQRLAAVSPRNRQAGQLRDKGHLTFSSAAGRKNWNEQIDEIADEKRKHFEETAAVRAEALARGLALSGPEKRKLMVAAKGAAQRCLANWKNQSHESLDRLETVLEKRFPGQNVQFRMSLPKVDSLDRDELWRYTVNTLRASAPLSNRGEYRRNAVAGYLTAWLDKELWLTPDQRDPFENLVKEALPATIHIARPDVKEVELLAIPLFRISNDALAVLLTEPQQTAWKSLQSQFQIDGDFVVLPTTRGDQLRFSLPPDHVVLNEIEE